MSVKSRSNYQIYICLKECANKDKKCKECLKWSEFEPIKDDSTNN